MREKIDKLTPTLTLFYPIIMVGQFIVNNYLPTTTTAF